MYYRQPRYYKDFQCIGGECKDNCCKRNWRIAWGKDEIDKVKNAPDCPEEIREFMELGFMPHPDIEDKFLVVLDKQTGCPMLTEDGFCRIQREMGAEYLSNTCTTYPRVNIGTGSTLHRHCNMSCPEIIKMILNDEKCMDLINIPIKAEVLIKDAINMDLPEKMKNHPEWQYADEIKEFFYEIISDKKLPLESCIILGALAAQSLTKLVGTGDYDSIPEAIKALRPQMHNAAQLKSIENIKPNYNIKLGVTDKLIREFFRTNTMNALADGEGKLNIDLYKRAEELLDKEFEDRPFIWRNLALNLLLELNTPFKLEDNTIFENYSLFVISYALMRHNSLSVISFNDRVTSEEHTEAVSVAGHSFNFNMKVTRPHLAASGIITGFSAKLSRILFNNDDNLNEILTHLQDFNFTSPAYLALLVK